MAEVLSQPSPALGFEMAASPHDSSFNFSENAFVDAPENPLPSTTSDMPSASKMSESGRMSNEFSLPVSEDVGAGMKHQTRRSVALPEFSFNPSASLDASHQQASPPLSPGSPTLHPSPSKGRHKHRRTRSELPGVDVLHQGAINDMALSTDVQADNSTKIDAQGSGLLPLNRGPSVGKGHKHRRSAAVSKDLTALANRTSRMNIVEAAEGNLDPSSPTFGSHFLPSSQDPDKAPKSSSPVRVTFAEDVEVIPRRSLPTLKTPSLAPSRPIHTSDGSQSHQDIPSFTFGYSPEPSADDFRFETISRSQESLTSLGDFPPVSIVEHANDDIFSVTNDNEVMLSENFDEDPTAAVEIGTYSDEPQLPSPRSPATEFNNGQTSEPIIDLDTANEVTESTAMTAEDLRNLRAKSFSAARRSMHSGGMDPSTARSGIPAHRRTESAPSMAAEFFERPSLPRYTSDTADSASEKGFQMENVFEEDEEEARVAEAEEEDNWHGSLYESQQEELGLGIVSSLCPKAQPRDLSLEESGHRVSDAFDDHDTPTPTNDGDIPSRSQTIRRASSNRQSLVFPEASTEELGNGVSILQSADDGLRPVSQPLPNLTAPPWMHQQDASSFGSTPHEQSHSSAWSTPKLDTAATSMSDAPQLSLPRIQGDGYTTSSISTEAIPSLISSHSTVSGVDPYAGSVAAPSTPSGGQSRHSNMSMGSQAERRRKRSSIASLSQLMSLSRSGGGRSNLSVEQDSRCQTSSGLSSSANLGTPHPGKEKRMKRLSRALKFWKAKEETTHP